MTQCIALLRGINVGRAKRIAMADLRTLIEGLGFTDVRTLLNSGNAVFQASRPGVARIAADMEGAIEASCGFPVAVVVLTARELDAVIAGNPLPQAAQDPSRFLVAFAGKAATLEKAKALLAQAWEPDALAVGSKAAYLWCASGIIESRLAQAFSKSIGDAATARNWATVLKLQAMAGTPSRALNRAGTGAVQ